MNNLPSHHEAGIAELVAVSFIRIKRLVATK